MRKNESIRLFQRGQSDALESMFSRASIAILADELTRNATRKAETEKAEEAKRMSDEDLIAEWKRLRGYDDPSFHCFPCISVEAWKKILSAVKDARGL